MPSSEWTGYVQQIRLEEPDERVISPGDSFQRIHDLRAEITVTEDGRDVLDPKDMIVPIKGDFVEEVYRQIQVRPVRVKVTVEVLP